MTIDDSSATLRGAVAALMPRVRTELATLVAIPSVADPRQYPPENLPAGGRVGAAARSPRWASTRCGWSPTPEAARRWAGHRPGPPGPPTVLLYFHHDVQPPLDDAAWTTPVWELTESGGRWHGRGAADCKGNIAMHLTALRALGDDLPVPVKIIGEGSEEQGTGGLEDFVPRNADLLRADAILVCDAGNFAVGVPSLTTSLRGLANVVVTVDALTSPMHSGMFGGAAPDALQR